MPLLLYWKRYTDSNFTLRDTINHAIAVLHRLNNCHSNVKFACDKEKYNKFVAKHHF